MASEIRVNKIENRSGLGTVTFADTGVDLAGIVTATTFSGSGASLTSLPAAQVTGTLPAISGANLTNLTATNLTGTIADARFPATLPAASAANLTSIPAANITGTLPALSAASLTNIPAANIVGVCTSGLTKTGGFGGGKILQVVQAAKTDTASTTSGTYVTISGLSVDITPSSSSNKILVIADVKAGNDGGNGYYLQIVRDSTAIYVGDSASGKQQCVQQTYGGGDTGEGKYGMAKMGGTFLDSPNTTSQVTYAVQFLRLGGNSPQTLYVNRVGSETAGEYVGRAASSITAIEVEA